MMDALPLHDARKAGLKEGIALGEKRGLLAGARNAKFETAGKLLKENISSETIAKCTGLSLEQVKKLKEQINH